jgi:hypothetical protein
MSRISLSLETCLVFRTKAGLYCRHDIRENHNLASTRTPLGTHSNGKFTPRLRSVTIHLLRRYELDISLVSLAASPDSCLSGRYCCFHRRTISQIAMVVLQSLAVSHHDYQLLACLVRGIFRNRNALQPFLLSSTLFPEPRNIVSIHNMYI